MGYSFKFKDLDFDFSDNTRISYWDFLLSEFFNADTKVKNSFRKAYLDRYGVGAYNHMIRNFWESWEKGSRILSDTQSSRIYSLMQNLLNDNAKYRLGMNEFMMSIKQTIKDFTRNQKLEYSRNKNIQKTAELIQYFNNELKKIDNLKPAMIGVHVLGDDEKDEALQISKYILRIKLQNAFDQIDRDFKVFTPFMHKFKRSTFSANYSIKLFNLSVDLTNTIVINSIFPQFKIDEIESNSRYRLFSDKYLAQELISIRKDAGKSVCDSFLNASDLELFINHYEKLLSGNSEANMNSTFQGEGGILSLKIQVRPLVVLKNIIVVSIARLSIYTILTFVMFSLAMRYKLFLVPVIFFGIFLLNLIYEQYMEVRTYLNEIKSHGK